MKAVMLAGMIAVAIASMAAAQDTLWTRAYGGPANDYIQSVRQTTDGGYMFCGATESYGSGDWDVYILRTDAAGDTLWTRTFGGTDRDIASSLDRTNEGDFIITGETAGSGVYDGWILKVEDDCQSGVPGKSDGRRGEAGLVPNGCPNPFREHTQVYFNVSKGGHVRLDIYVVLGHQVDVLLEDSVPPGNHAVTWDASGLAPGMYFIKLTAGSNVSVASVVLVM